MHFTVYITVTMEFFSFIDFSKVLQTGDSETAVQVFIHSAVFCLVPAALLKLIYVSAIVGLSTHYLMT